MEMGCYLEEGDKQVHWYKTQQKARRKNLNTHTKRTPIEVSAVRDADVVLVVSQLKVFKTLHCVPGSVFIEILPHSTTAAQQKKKQRRRSSTHFTKFILELLFILFVSLWLHLLPPLIVIPAKEDLKLLYTANRQDFSGGSQHRPAIHCVTTSGTGIQVNNIYFTFTSSLAPLSAFEDKELLWRAREKVASRFKLMAGLRNFFHGTFA